MASAGVITQEIDLSTRVPSFPGVYGAIVIQAKKGPVGVPTLVTTDTELLNLFTPNGKVEVGFDLAYFSALAYLQKSNKLWVVRAAKQSLYGGVSVKTSSHAGSSATVPLTAGLSDPTAYAFDAGPDVAAVAEVTSVTCVADIAGSLNNKYFFLNEPASGNGVYVWFNVGGNGVDPGPFGSRVALEVAFAEGATAAQVATAIAAVVDASSAYAASAVGAVITVTNSVAGAVADATAQNSGFTVAVVTPGSDAVSQTDEAMLIYAANQGAWANQIGVKVITYTANPDKVKEPGAFLIEVYKSSNTSTPIESFLCSRLLGTKDGYGQNIFIEDVLQSSNYIRAISNPAVAGSVLPAEVSTIAYMTYGSDGLAVTDAEMVTAIDSLSNVDNLPLTVVMDGGWATPAFQQAIDSLCQNRGDCVGVLSCPIAAEASTSYIADISTYRKTTLNLNSSYTAIYSPHVQIYDKFNDRKIYVSPDGYAAAAISYSASNFEIWFPPAGFKRGAVTVLDLRRRFTKGERDALYDIGVNPLRFTPGKGIAIWGQKTLLSRPSSLDRLNVRLMLIVIEPALASALEDFTFEFNDEATRSLVKAILDSYMTGIQARRGVYDFRVVCDESNNTADVIENNQMYADVYVKPEKSAEEIYLRVIITSRSISFEQAQAAV